MTLPEIRITYKKNGVVQPWFRTDLGRVRTALFANRERTARMADLAEYGRNLIVDRAFSGIGANDQHMPGLKRGYAIRKTRAGLGNRRNLYGTGKDQGHMLDDVRVTAVTDTRFEVGITRRKSIEKARGNELKAPWWGWSPSDMRKLLAMAQRMMLMNAADIARVLGFNTAFAAARPFMGGRFASRLRSSLRRAA